MFMVSSKAKTVAYLCSHLAVRLLKGIHTMYKAL